MKNKWFKYYGVALIIFSSCQKPVSEVTPQSGNEGNTHELSVNYSEVVAPVQSTMYGIFFEDINFAADGGIYAEMIKNRSFEFTDPLAGWTQPQSDRFSMNENTGFASAINKGNDMTNNRFLRVSVKSDNGYFIENEGFRGLGIKEGRDYFFTVDARQVEGRSIVHVELLDSSGNGIGNSSINLVGDEWKEYKTTLTASETEMKGKFRLRFEGEGVVDIDMVSLFPSDTWKGREKGLRADLVQLLADLDPGFLRFPGGCIVEGSTLSRRYQWKKTVGEIENRNFLINRWNQEFKHRLTPDYYQSFGLGFYEYFELAEDMGAEPLPILSCGMSCQFNTGELVSVDDIGSYIQDAIDLIEFANGPVTSKWGKVRAEMGHPEPFNMKYIGIGNEQWGPEYITRYKEFEKVLKAEHPEIIIVSGSGPFPDGEMFEYGWQELTKLNAEIIDEHYYRNPSWFLENADRYDSYDRNGPKVFAGEYAAQSVAIASPDNKNNWECALAEAAFMTGLERNADIVHLTSYAPLLAHAEGWQWTPDLIWFNNLEAYGTPNYYVQKLYSTNRGTDLLKVLKDEAPLTGKGGLYASAVKDSDNDHLILKIVNTNQTVQQIKVNVEGVQDLEKEGVMEVLSSTLNDLNTFESPENIKPVNEKVKAQDNKLSFTIKPYSLNVIRIKANKASTI